MSIGKRLEAEQFVHKRRDGDVLIGQGLAAPEVIRRLEMSDKTYHRWRKEYGGLKVHQAKPSSTGR